MKKTIILSLLFAGFGIAALAQTDRIIKAPDSAKMQMRAQQGGNMRQQNMQMIKELDLTAAQQEQLKKSMEDMRTKMEDLRDNTTLTPEQKRDQIKAMRDEQKTKMEALLTPEQMTKWEASRKKMMAERSKNPDMGNVRKDTFDKNNSNKSEPQ